MILKIYICPRCICMHGVGGHRAAQRDDDHIYVYAYTHTYAYAHACQQADIVRLNATMIGQLETEISMYKSESLKQRKIVHHLEKVAEH